MKEKLLRFIPLLGQYVGCRSVSTDKAYADGIQDAVTFLKTQFEENGFMVTLLQGPSTNPVVVASYHQSDDMKTIGVYGHYDVQPAQAGGNWIGDPFVLREDDDRVYGRGVMDNKAQNLMHVFTVFELIKKGELGCNVKFIIEGNEETQNPDMADLVAKNADLLKCDTIIVSDGEMNGNTPCIEASLRGGCSFTLSFKTANDNVHSGTYGGAIPNSAHEMTAFLAKMLPADGPVAIPGFYDGIDEISDEKIAYHLELLKHTDPITHKGIKKMIGDYDFYTMTGLRPTMQITGFLSGYVGEGYSNIVPGETVAKINVRLVASQEPDAFKEMLEQYLKDTIPAHVEWTMSMTKISPAVKVNIDSPEIKEIMEWQEKIYGKKPVIQNVGGGIPIVADFKELLGVDSILLPLGGTDSCMHGSNENMRKKLIECGLQLSEMIFKKR